MGKQIRYEWAIEQVDAYGDVVDVNHYETLAQLRRDLDDEETGGAIAQVVLVRDVVDESFGVLDRQWAYPETDGGEIALPNFFDGGAKVPARFHRQTS